MPHRGPAAVATVLVAIALAPAASPLQGPSPSPAGPGDEALPGGTHLDAPERETEASITDINDRPGQHVGQVENPVPAW